MIAAPQQYACVLRVGCSGPGGHLKSPHLWPGQTPPPGWRACPLQKKSAAPGTVRIAVRPARDFESRAAIVPEAGVEPALGLSRTGF